MTCTRCGTDRPRANLTLVGDELVCPECQWRKADAESKHQVPAPPVRANEDHGLRVVDVARGNAGRLAALARRRSA